jgi:hypothetical protein
LHEGPIVPRQHFCFVAGRPVFCVFEPFIIIIGPLVFFVHGLIVLSKALQCSSRSPFLPGQVFRPRENIEDGEANGRCTDASYQKYHCLPGACVRGHSTRRRIFVATGGQSE